MRLLLDTHTLIWAAQEPELLPEVARTRPDIAWASWRSRPARRSISSEVESQGFIVLPLDGHHAQRGGMLAIPHEDPFDRLLIAQSQVEGMILVSNEELFDEWHIPRLWSKPPYKEL